MNTTEKEVGALAAEKLSPLGSKYFIFFSKYKSRYLWVRQTLTVD